MFHPVFFLRNSIDQYPRFHTSRTPRTVTVSSGPVLIKKTTGFTGFFLEQFMWHRGCETLATDNSVVVEAVIRLLSYLQLQLLQVTNPRVF